MDNASEDNTSADDVIAVCGRQVVDRRYIGHCVGRYVERCIELCVERCIEQCVKRCV